MNNTYRKGYAHGKKDAKYGMPKTFDRVIQGVIQLDDNESVTDYALGYQEGYEAIKTNVKNNLN